MTWTWTWCGLAQSERDDLLSEIEQSRPEFLEEAKGRVDGLVATLRRYGDCTSERAPERWRPVRAAAVDWGPSLTQYILFADAGDFRSIGLHVIVVDGTARKQSPPIHETIWFEATYRLEQQLRMMSQH